MPEKENLPFLESWSFQMKFAGPYQPPESAEVVLIGKIYGDSRFSEGAEVITSSVRHVDFKEGLARTRFTLYRLGKMDPRFSQWMEENHYTLDQYEKAANSR